MYVGQGRGGWEKRHRAGWGGLERNWEGKNGEGNIDKLDMSFTALGCKKEQRCGAGAKEQYGVKGGLLFF